MEDEDNSPFDVDIFMSPPYECPRKTPSKSLMSISPPLVFASIRPM